MTNMKEYFAEDDSAIRPHWMTLFISLMLVLLTLFIFLSTFAEGNKLKIEQFQSQFRKSLMMTGQGGMGRPSVTDLGTPDDPLRLLINRMKSSGINKKLMDEFLTLSQIKELNVMDGKGGVAIILPETVGFTPGENQLTDKAKEYLHRILFLVDELPYLVEIKGYSSEKVPQGFTDPLEFSSRRALSVYTYFISQNIPPVKLKVSGCGDAFHASGIAQDKVEIIFKSPEM